MDCLFCKIVNKQLPSEIVYDADDLMVFKDIRPSAPIHLLIVPKMEQKHIDSVNDLEGKDEKLIAEMILMAKKVAKDFWVFPIRLKIGFQLRGGGRAVVCAFVFSFL